MSNFEAIVSKVSRLPDGSVTLGLSQFKGKELKFDSVTIADPPDSVAYIEGFFLHGGSSFLRLEGTLIAKIDEAGQWNWHHLNKQPEDAVDVATV